jgi:2'-5' RNA ligase
MAQFLIMVRVPELEPHVARLRAQFDPSARRGLAAHITLLHSNLTADRVDGTALEKIAAAATSTASFDYQITRVARFPGTVYLAAEPAAPFVLLRKSLALVLRMEEREQQGQEPLIPHVSVVRKSSIDDRGVEAELIAMLERHGPIACACKGIALLENSSGQWRTVQEYSLSDDTGNPWPGAF